MRQKGTKKLYNVTLLLPKNMTKTVKVKAVDQETAERRAMKYNPTVLGVKRQEKADHA